MYILGIQGSPRKNGNSDYLLTSFLKECERRGARTEVIRTQGLDIQPCRELLVCENQGHCPIRDQMEEQGYKKVRQADVVVLASPVFFYGISAQAKVFIDRCQMFWGRKYKLGLRDPARFSRQGFLLSVAASGGKRLFEGVELTARYFFDAISADYAGSLTYKKVEDAGDIIVRPELAQEIEAAVAHLLAPLEQARKLLFVSPGGRCRAIMAAAAAMDLSRGKVRARAAGLAGSGGPAPETVTAMTQARVDVKYMQAADFARPGPEWERPDFTVFLGSRQEFETAQDLLGQGVEFWDLPRVEGEDLTGLATSISERVKFLVDRI